MGRLDEAWREIEAAAAIEPDNYGVFLKRAWIRYHQGRFEEAYQMVCVISLTGAGSNMRD